MTIDSLTLAVAFNCLKKVRKTRAELDKIQCQIEEIKADVGKPNSQTRRLNNEPVSSPAPVTK